MPNILEDLYYGNISPNERRVRHGSKIQKAMQKRDVLETKLNESFTDEQKAIMQAIADTAYDQFTGIVADSRKMPIDTVTELADGRLYTARQAESNGLIDEICT